MIQKKMESKDTDTRHKLAKGDCLISLQTYLLDRD